MSTKIIIDSTVDLPAQLREKQSLFLKAICHKMTSLIASP